MTRDEARAAGLKRYSGVPCKWGHSGERYVGNNDCVECSTLRAAKYAKANREAAAERASKWREKNREKHREYSREYARGDVERNREKASEWQKKNTDQYQENQRKAYERRKEVYKKKAQEWAKANPGKRRSIMVTNRVKRRSAEPPLSQANKDWINFTYETCPKGWDVDHIYPINGKNTCGLHVPWNLQHLPANINRSKSNKLPKH